MDIKLKSCYPGSNSVSHSRKTDYLKNGSFSASVMPLALDETMPEPFSLAGVPMSEIFPIEFVNGRYKMKDGWNETYSHENALMLLDPFMGKTRAGINIDNIVVDDLDALYVQENGEYAVTVKCNFVKGTFTMSYFPLKSFLHCLYQIMDMKRYTGVDVTELALSSAEAIADTLLLQTVFRPFKDTISSEVRLDVNTVLRMVMHFVYYYHNYETSDVSYALKRANSDAVAALTTSVNYSATGVRINEVDMRIKRAHINVMRDKLRVAGINPDVYTILKAPILAFTCAFTDVNANVEVSTDSKVNLSTDYVEFSSLLAANNLSIEHHDVTMHYDQWYTNSITNNADISMVDGQNDVTIKCKGELGFFASSSEGIFTSFATITKVSEITDWSYAPSVIIENGHYMMAGNDDDPFYYSISANSEANLVCDEETKEVHSNQWLFHFGDDEPRSYAIAVLPGMHFDYQMLINKYRAAIGDGLLRAMLSTKLTSENIADILHMANESDFSDIDPLILKQVITEQNNYKMSLTSLISIGVRELINVLGTTDVVDLDSISAVKTKMRSVMIPVDSIVYQRHLEKWTSDLVNSNVLALSLHDVLLRYVYPTTVSCATGVSFDVWLFSLVNNALSETVVVNDNEVDLCKEVSTLVEQADNEYVSTLAASFSDALENVVDDYVSSVSKDNLNAAEVQSLLNQQAESFLSSIDSDATASIIDALQNDDSSVNSLFKKVRDACSTKASSIVSTIPSYIEGYKNGDIFNSYTVQRFLEKATKISNPLELVYNANNAKSATDLGWSSNTMYSDASKLDIAIGAVPGDTIVAGCIVATKAIIKSVKWLGNKVRDFVGSTIKDGVSYKVNASGYATLNVQAVTQLFDVDEFAYLYPNLAEVIKMQQGLIDSHYCVCQFGPMYAFIQTVGRTVIVTCNPKIDRKTEDQALSGNDYLFIRQVAESIHINQKFHNALLDYMIDKGIINEAFDACLRLEVDSVDVILRDIENRASAISRSSAIAKKSAWGILGIAAGALLCCTGYGSVAGVAIIAACTGAAIACSDPVPEKDLTAIERLKEDAVYANDLIKANDFVNLLQNGVSYAQLAFMLQSLDVLSNFNLKGDVSQCFSLVHNGTGYVYGEMEDYLNADEVPLGFIPLVTMAGTPAFKYVLVSDAERLTSFLTGVAVIGAVAVAAIGTFAGATIRKARIKKYDALNAELWSGTSDTSSKAYQGALMKCKKTRRLENKLLGSSASPNDNPMNIMQLYNAADTAEQGENALTPDDFDGFAKSEDLASIATKDDVAAVDFSNLISVALASVPGAVRQRGAIDGALWLVTSMLGIIANQEMNQEETMDELTDVDYYNPRGIIK